LIFVPESARTSPQVTVDMRLPLLISFDVLLRMDVVRPRSISSPDRGRDAKEERTCTQEDA
jgi:hypothetical protein